MIIRLSVPVGHSCLDVENFLFEVDKPESLTKAKAIAAIKAFGGYCVCFEENLFRVLEKSDWQFLNDKEPTYSEVSVCNCLSRITWEKVETIKL